MAYVGNVPAVAYTNTVKDTFSGDGSTVAFTLSLPTTTNNVRVVVENVIQDPTVAYGVSGTTLTFTSAPPSGTNNIYVVHLGPAVQTVQPPTELSGNFTLTGDLTQTGALTVTGTAQATSVRTATLSDAAGTGPATLTGQSAAKAWVNFNGTGTIAARDSLNLSSLTDNAVGQYGVAYTSAFAAADYWVGGAARYNAGTSNGGSVTIDTQLAGSMNVFSQAVGTIFDTTIFCVSASGDLA